MQQNELENERPRATYQEEQTAVRNYVAAKIAASLATQLLLAKMTGGLSLLITVPTMFVSHCGRNVPDCGSFLFEDGFVDAIEDETDIIKRLPDNSSMPTEAIKSGLTRGVLKNFFAPVVHALMPLTAAVDGVHFVSRKILAVGKTLDLSDPNRIEKANDLAETKFDMECTNALRDLGRVFGAISPHRNQTDIIKRNSRFSRDSYSGYSW